MPSILLTVFTLQLVIHIVNTLGASTINNLLWTLYTSITAPKAAAEQRELKKKFMQVRTEMNGTSSQDEFARWAKLRRQHDKLLEQLEKSKSSTDASRSSFDTSVSTLRWLATNGLRFFIQWWYSRRPIFWVPRGWAPYYAEWLLSFPRAPLGSVSVNVWALACAAVILLAHDAIVAVVALARTSGAREKSGEEKKQVKVPAAAAKGEKKDAEKKDAEKKDAEKKEL